MQIVIDIDEETYDWIKWAVNGDIGNVLEIAIANGTVLPDNATNGDIFRAIYTDISRMGTILIDDIENIIATNVNIGWWNAPYQKGGK